MNMGKMACMSLRDTNALFQVRGLNNRPRMKQILAE